MPIGAASTCLPVFFPGPCSCQEPLRSFPQPRTLAKAMSRTPEGYLPPGFVPSI